jgi:tetratricopeptide (TPR) repeat protein
MGTAQSLRDAYKHQLDGLELVSRPAHVADALCNLVDLCVDMRKVEVGVKHALAMESVLASDPEAGEWEAPFLHNYGRLLALAGDHHAAQPRLERSVSLFTAAGQKDEACAVQAALAGSLLAVGRCDEAEELCRQVKRTSNNSRVQVEVNILQTKLAVSRGEITEAGRLLERAITHAANTVGQADFRIMVELLNVEADVDTARGDHLTARRLRLLAQTWAAAGAVDR